MRLPPSRTIACPLLPREIGDTQGNIRRWKARPFARVPSAFGLTKPCCERCDLPCSHHHPSRGRGWQGLPHPVERITSSTPRKRLFPARIRKRRERCSLRPTRQGVLDMMYLRLGGLAFPTLYSRFCVCAREGKLFAHHAAPAWLCYRRRSRAMK